MRQAPLTSPPDRDRPAPARAGGRWSAWTWVWLLVGSVTLARLVFLAVTGVELSGDEAHYWEWSRRPGLSYYSKGPGVAWLIACSTAVLGDSEWAVRVPAVLCGAGLALVGAGLAVRVGRVSQGAGSGAEAPGLGRGEEGGGRAALLGAAVMLLYPPYQVASLLMTIDIPFFLCWMAAVWAAARALEAWRRGRSSLPGWLLVAALCGVGFLFKYTMLLLVPGLVWMAWLERGRGRATGRSSPAVVVHRAGVAWMHGLLAVGAFVLVISPVLIWNHRHGWPTVRHLVGSIGLPGGDRPSAGAGVGGWSYSPLPMLEMMGTQLAFLGPATLLIAAACWAHRRIVRRGGDDPGTADRSLLIVSALPILLFYAAISVFSKVQGNWPVAGLGTLLLLAAAHVAGGGPRIASGRIEQPEPSDTGCRGGDRPLVAEGRLRRWWRWTVIFGLITGLGVGLVEVGLHIPRLAQRAPLNKVNGRRELAVKVAVVMDRLSAERAGHANMGAGPGPGTLPGAGAGAGALPGVMAGRYDVASGLAFYLPGRPRVYSAASLMGDRKSSYDFFPDTDLSDPQLIGRDFVLVHGSMERWKKAVRFDRWEVVSEVPSILIGRSYRGPLTGRALPPTSPKPGSTDASALP